MSVYCGRLGCRCDSTCQSTGAARDVKWKLGIRWSIVIKWSVSSQPRLYDGQSVVTSNTLAAVSQRRPAVVIVVIMSGGRAASSRDAVIVDVEELRGGGGTLVSRCWLVDDASRQLL